MEWGIQLDKSSDIPLYRQLSSALIELIDQNKLKPDTKLPPIRQMARALDINGTTVISAYKYLERKTVVYSILGSGTYVARPMPAVPSPVQAHPVISDNYINFTHMATEAALFPVAAFKRSFNSVMDKDGAAAFGYHDSRGYGPLRESLCKLLSGFEITASPDHVHVISGVEQGLNILANTLLTPGDTVFVERFASQNAVAAFLSRRAFVVEIPAVEDEPDFHNLEALLKKHKPKLIYISSNFQQPKGICYSSENKRHLLDLVYTYDVHVIEEDLLNDFYYDNKKRTTFKALDNQDKTIYVKNFSRTLMPGLGIGFMVCPGTLADTMLNIETPPPGYTQRALDVFLRNGDYESHIANMRMIYGRRYQKITAAAGTYLTPFADFELPGGGLSLWITPRRSEADNYAGKFLQRKVIVTPGRLFANDMRGFRISFASVPEDRIAEGIGVIASVLHEAIQTSR